MNNYTNKNELLQMSQFIKSHKIHYLSEFVDYCLRFNLHWFELIVDNQKLQHVIIMILEDYRADNEENAPLDVGIV
jgi:hypothetical protein